MENSQFFTTNSINYEVFNSIKKEQNSIGYYNLVDEDISYIIKYAKNITKKNIVIVGIGGSTLGTYAVYSFLRHTTIFTKRLILCDSTDPVILNSRLDDLDFDDTLFIIISKSGTTIETISIFKYILSLVPLTSDSFIIVSQKDSKLHKLSVKKNIDFFEISSNVGGRFSVLSVVGLLPLALIGVDIKKLLKGAFNIKNSFFNKEDIYNSLIKKANFYAKNTNTYNINCLFSYSECFRGFNAWYTQLWGESLAKKQLNSSLNVSLTPIGLIGPGDQHSFLQLIAQGKADKTVTFLKIKDFKSNIKIPNISIKHLEELDYINGVDFSSLINMQADSIIKSLSRIGDIPLDIIQIDTINESNIGELFYYFELLTSLVAKLLDIDAYNQPGVEDGKKILKSFFE
jgi:glucose-6-phosphate isomerase